MQQQGDIMPLAPEYAAMLAELAAAEGPAISDLSPAEGREMYRLMRPVNPDIAVGKIENTTIPGPAGAIPVRIYTPQGAGPFPVFVNFHGGGWVIGDLDTADAVCRGICRDAGCVVVSVDYRLAPEHPFPAAVEDAYAATAWAAGNMSALQGNGRLAVGGESSGGNLAAVVCQQARDAGGPDIAFQLLAYPVVDCQFDRASYQENGRATCWSWIPCAGSGITTVPARKPARLLRHRPCGPTIWATCRRPWWSRRSSIHCATRGKPMPQALKAAGGTVTAIRYDGLVHDFFATAELFESSRSGFREACRVLQQALAATSPLSAEYFSKGDQPHALRAHVPRQTGQSVRAPGNPGRPPGLCSHPGGHDPAGRAAAQRRCRDMAGSLFIIEADSADEVRAFHQADPYTLAELWETVSLHPFRQVAAQTMNPTLL
jgi:acetyl esterase